MEFEYSRANPRVTVAFASFEAMHTVLEGVVTDLDEPAARQLFVSVETRVREIESRLNRHDPASLFARINASQGRETVPLDEETYVLLQLAEVFRRTTDGYFDLAALSGRSAGGATGGGGVTGGGSRTGTGGVTGVCGATRPEGVSGPGDKTGPGGATGDRRGAVSGAAAGGKMPDTPGCVLDPATRSVRLTGEEVLLDAGGFGKGYALERIRPLLTEAGVRSALFNFGDSSVMSVGTHPLGDCWPVGTVAGGEPFRLVGSSLSISGLHPDGRAHIVDPTSGRMVSRRTMVAVEGRSAFLCEVLSTALYAAPADLRDRIAARFEGYRYTEIGM